MFEERERRAKETGSKMGCYKWILVRSSRGTVCSYHKKEEAKLAGAQWDSSYHQLRFCAYDTETEARLARWLPSSKSNAAKAKAAVLTQSQIAKLPKINSDMTIVQLKTECWARDPNMDSRYKKNRFRLGNKERGQ